MVRQLPLNRRGSNHALDLMSNVDSWVKEYLAPRYPELVAPYREAVRIAEDATSRGAISRGPLETLLQHARNPRKPLGENVASMLGRLANHFPEAQAGIRELAADSQVSARVNALVALLDHNQGALHEELLSVALTDKSSKVRELAADRIMYFGIRRLIPDLENAITHATSDKHRETLAWELALLRDGYFAKKEDGRVWITCRTAEGVKSTSFPSETFDTAGRDWIAKTAQVAS